MARRGDGLPRATPVAKSAPRPERQIAFQLGISAEGRAAAFLIAKGFRILARHWKSPAGEIEIVARRRHLLNFVEVKARAALDEAAESVNASAAPHRGRGGSLARRQPRRQPARFPSRCDLGGARQIAAPYPGGIRDKLNLRAQPLEELIDLRANAAGDVA